MEDDYTGGDICIDGSTDCTGNDIVYGSRTDIHLKKKPLRLEGLLVRQVGEFSFLLLKNFNIVYECKWQA